MSLQAALSTRAPGAGGGRGPLRWRRAGHRAPAAAPRARGRAAPARGSREFSAATSWPRPARRARNGCGRCWESREKGGC